MSDPATVSGLQTDITEIKSDLKHVVRLVEKHDRSLYGEDGGDGIVSDLKSVCKLIQKHEKSLYGEDGTNGMTADVKRHNSTEKSINRVVAVAVGLVLTNIGALGKIAWSYLTAGSAAGGGQR